MLWSPLGCLDLRLVFTPAWQLCKVTAADFSQSVFGDTWLLQDKCLGAKFGDSCSDTPTHERAIPHRPAQLNRALSDGLKKEVKRSVYNTEILDVFADLIDSYPSGFFFSYSFKMSHKTPQTISHFQKHSSTLPAALKIYDIIYQSASI